MEAVRPAGPDDAETVAGLLGALAAEVAPRRGGTLLLARVAQAGGGALAAGAGRLVDDPDTLTLVGTIDGVPAGCVVGHAEHLPDGTRLGVLDACYVEPGARGVGLGHLLAETAVAWLRDQGCTGVDGLALPGDREAKGFFESAGFKARLLTMHRPLP